jgi:dihydrofolate reductase
MRDVILTVANSLDNYIAREDGAIDWLLWSDEVAKELGAFWERIDTVVMGRKTYDAAVELGGGSESYPGMKVIVFSRTISKSADSGATFVSIDAVEFVRELKQQDGKAIWCLGGGEIAQALFDADLIDEIGLNVHPVLLGSGVPLFLPLRRSVELALQECLRVEHGCVMLTYRMKR